MTMRAETDGTVGSDAVGDAERPPTQDLITLYEEYRKRIFQICLSYLRHPADAEDAVQETFIRATGHVEHLVGDVSAYLYVIARRVCCDELRRRRPKLSIDEATEQASRGTAVDPESQALMGEALNKLWARLSDRDRDLLSQEFAGFTYQEIASRTGLSMSSVSVGLLRARQRVRRMALAVSSVILVPAGLSRLVQRAGRRLALAPQSVGPATLFSLQEGGLLVACLVTSLVGGSALVGVQSQPSGRVALASGSSPSMTSPSQSGASNDAPHGGVLVPAATPTPSSSGLPAGLGVGTSAPIVLLPGQSARQEDATFSSLAASPHYQQDHTAYASGSLITGCGGRPYCPVLFQSTDGGLTWRDLQPRGFLGGQLVLPPAFPADPTLFVSGPAGLQRSDDAGLSFTVVVPAASEVPAAAVPGTPSGEAQIGLLSEPPLVYDERSGVARPGPTLPVGVSSVSDAAYLGATGALLIAASQVDASNPNLRDGVVVLCKADGGCATSYVMPGEPSLHFVVDTISGSMATVFVYSGDALASSTDGGRTFTVLRAPAGSPISTLALRSDFTSSRSVSMAVQTLLPSGASRAELLASGDSGRSFGTVQSGELASFKAVSALLWLPDGRLLASVMADHATFGIRCSSDGGSTWRYSC